jgi:hypothetical protein
VPLSQRPGLHVFLEDGTSETLEYGEVLMANRVDDTPYKFPNVLRGEVVWLNETGACELDHMDASKITEPWKALAATLAGKVVAYPAGGCNPNRGIYQFGVVLTIQVAEEVSRSDTQSFFDEVPYPNLMMKKSDATRLMGQGIVEAQFSLPTNMCVAKLAGRVPLIDGLSSTCCVASDVALAHHHYEVDYWGSGYALLRNCRWGNEEFPVSCLSSPDDEPTCTELCVTDGNGICEDGGANSTASMCSYGSGQNMKLFSRYPSLLSNITCFHFNLDPT